MPMPVDLSKDELSIKVNDGAPAKYEFVGVCQQPGCGARLFRCTSHPLRADELLGPHLAVFVPGGTNEPAQLYCQRHDPNAAMKQVFIPTDEFGRPLTPGDLYVPSYMRN